MPNYSKGKIYTIRCKNDDSKIYVGSTCQTLAKRLCQHKKDSTNVEKYPNHRFYRTLDNWDDWYIELYELFPCQSKEELNKKEGEVIRQIGTLNRGIAGRSTTEWKRENPEKVAIYREKDKLREIETGRCTIMPCECGGRYSMKSIRTHERSQKHINFLNKES